MSFATGANPDWIDLLWVLLITVVGLTLWWLPAVILLCAAIWICDAARAFWRRKAKG